MALTIVATPIGHLDDITVRGLNALKNCTHLIGEEFKVADRLCKQLQIGKKEIYLLNEHTRERDIAELVEICKTHDTCLISDAGTPNFCDPGFMLISKLRNLKVPINSVPGASSLMTLISYSSKQIREFYFAGFLPSDNSQRKLKLETIAKLQVPIVVMDTPYRLEKTMADLVAHFGSRTILFGANLTAVSEKITESHEREIVIESPLKNLLQQLPKGLSAPFVALIY